MDQFVVQWLPTSGSGNGLWLLLILVLVTLIFGTFMSNTAVATLLLPIGISAALSAPAGGLSPVQAAMSIAFTASLSMALPVSTPPNAIAYARGEFTTRDMARVALVVSALGALLIVAGGGFIMRAMGLVD